MDHILLISCIIITIGNIVLSILYFFKVKFIWRYIKLVYAFANLYMLSLLVNSYSGSKASASEQFLGLLVILSAMFGGLVVSFAKLQMATGIEDRKIKKFKTTLKSLK